MPRRPRRASVTDGVTQSVTASAPPPPQARAYSEACEDQGGQAEAEALVPRGRGVYHRVHAALPDNLDHAVGATSPGKSWARPMIIRTYTHTYVHTRTRARTHRQTDRHTHTKTYTHTHAHSLITHTHSLSYSHTHTHTYRSDKKLEGARSLTCSCKGSPATPSRRRRGRCAGLGRFSCNGLAVTV